MLTSYAQHFEDIMLWRALKHVQKGRYVDVGANDPNVDSVSRLFYEHGWRGLHVEPMPSFSERLRRFRPDEVVIEAAISDASGTVTLFQFEGTGLTTSHQEHAEQHVGEGRNFVKIEVEAIPLASILDRFGTQDVHWLKIDVEGMEDGVLRSWQAHPSRPWIVVVESTLPNSAEQNHDLWEQELVSRGYRFVYFDGLNRFYIHSLRPELAAAFYAPPNFFDRFVLSDHSPFVSNLALEIAELKQENVSLSAVTQEKAAEIGQLREQVNEKASVIGQLTEQVQEKASIIGQLTQQIEETASSISVLRQKIDQNDAEFDTLRASLVEKSERIGELANAQSLLERDLSAAVGEQARLIAHINWQNARLDEVWQSRSWQITKPLRSMSRLISKFSSVLRVHLKRVVRIGLELGRALVRINPWMRKPIRGFLSMVPQLRQRLLAFNEANRATDDGVQLLGLNDTRLVPPWSGTYQDDISIGIEILSQQYKKG